MMPHVVVALFLTLVYIIVAAVDLPTAQSIAWFYGMSVFVLCIAQRVQYYIEDRRHGR